jgi:hypothetical protein
MFPFFQLSSSQANSNKDLFQFHFFMTNHYHQSPARHATLPCGSFQQANLMTSDDIHNFLTHLTTFHDLCMTMMTNGDNILMTVKTNGEDTFKTR